MLGKDKVKEDESELHVLHLDASSSLQLADHKRRGVAAASRRRCVKLTDHKRRASPRLKSTVENFTSPLPCADFLIGDASQ